MPNDNNKACYFDEDRQLFIHVFKIHCCRCNCGKRVIKTPVTRIQGFLYGKKAK